MSKSLSFGKLYPKSKIELISLKYQPIYRYEDGVSLEFPLIDARHTKFGGGTI